MTHTDRGGDQSDTLDGGSITGGGFIYADACGIANRLNTSSDPPHGEESSPKLHFSSRITNFSCDPSFLPFGVEKAGTLSDIASHNYGSDLMFRITPTGNESLGDPVRVRITAAMDITYAGDGVELQYEARYNDGSGETTLLATGGASAEVTFDSSIGSTFSFAYLESVVNSSGYPEGTDFELTVQVLRGVNLSATAQWNDAQQPDHFGTYLQGVPLDNTFTVTAQNDSNHSITHMTYDVSGGEAGPVQYDASSGMGTFTTDMGQLSAGNTDLTITAYDAHDTAVATYHGILVAQDMVQLDLKASYPGDPQDPQPVDQFRFIDGTPINVTYTATVSSLPLFDAYKDKLDLGFRTQGGTTSVIYAQMPTLQPAGSNAGMATFTLSTQNFHDDGFDYGVSVVPRSQASAQELSSREQFRVIQLPAWMGNPPTTFDPTQGVYNIQFAFPPSLQLKLPATSDTKFGLFTNLQNSAGMGLRLAVTARPTIGANDVQLQPLSWFATATLLGHSLLDQSRPFLPSGIHVSANLDPITLNALSAIDLITDAFPLVKPGDYVFTKDFTAAPWVIPMPGGLHPDVGIEAFINAGLDTLTAQARVRINIGDDGSLSFDDPNTWILVTATGHLNLGLSLHAGLDILNYNLGDGTLTGTVTATASTAIMVNFGGDVLDPAPRFNTDVSYGNLTVGYSIDADIQLLGFHVYHGHKAKHEDISLFGSSGGGSPDSGSGAGETALRTLATAGPLAFQGTDTTGAGDALNVRVTVTRYDGLPLSLLDNLFASADDAYPIMTWGAVSGSFGMQNLPDLGDGFFLDPALGDTGLTPTTRAQ